MRVLKQILSKCLLVIFGLITGLFLVEFGVRVMDLYSFPPEDFVQPHSALGWSHVPNQEGYWRIGGKRVAVKINSKGLRDREYSYEKEAGTFRILVLGDSFTEAMQVSLEETFCKVLESKLNATQQNFEVINGGFSGVGTDYELTFFKHEGYKYRPDLVIIAFFANDVSDNYRSRRFVTDEKAMTAYERKGILVTVKKYLAEHSCAYNYFGYVVPAHMPTLAKVLMKLGLLSPQPIDKGQKADQYLVFTQTYGTEWQRAWDSTKALLLELNKLAKDHGSDTAVVSIPFREQISNEDWRAKRLHPEKGELDWDAGKPDRILAEFLDHAGIPFLPLMPTFRKAATESQLYYIGDQHWNKNGHRVAAETIYEWLVEENLVPTNEQRLKVQGAGLKDDALSGKAGL